MKQLHEYMDPHAVYFTDIEDKHEILDKLVELSYRTEKVPDHEEFRNAIFDREEIMSTGIGLGVAVPHAKLPSIEEFFITIGILKTPVDWQSIDDKPVSIVFLIGGPANRQNDYLRILSKLTLFSKNEKRREVLVAAESAEEVIRHFEPHT